MRRRSMTAASREVAMRLQGKVAVATAAAQGIGRATAEAFAREGATAFALAINELRSAEPRGEHRRGRRLDVLSAAAVSAFAKEVGTIDILFNCAGFVHAGTILDATEDQFAFAMDLNVRSMFRLIRAFLPGMLAQGRGSIINVASVVSSVKGAPNRCVYGVSKAAVIGLTKSVAADYVTQGIRCNAICPGTVQSPSLDDRMRALGDYDTARAAFVARQPMGRLGTPEEIAALAVYLASDEAQFTTGQAHIIDGGWAT